MVKLFINEVWYLNEYSSVSAEFTDYKNKTYYYFNRLIYYLWKYTNYKTDSYLVAAKSNLSKYVYYSKKYKSYYSNRVVMIDWILYPVDSKYYQVFKKLHELVYSQILSKQENWIIVPDEYLISKKYYNKFVIWVLVYKLDKLDSWRIFAKQVLPSLLWIYNKK
jgi:hypothetical protein